MPRQHSSGGKEKLLGISKRGDSYLRTLLIHGARSVQRVSANKNARMAWAVLSKGEAYRASDEQGGRDGPVLPTAAHGSPA